jgi:XTP/dITP diphosphohydrolase
MRNKNEILLTTDNPGKLQEAKSYLGRRGIHVYSPKDLGIAVRDVVEDGDTFEHNARLKVLAYLADAPQGVIVLGDDSGIEIKALGGKPGVFSRRIHGKDFPELADEEIQRVILEQMKDVPTEARTARFRTVLAAARAGLVGETTPTIEYFVGQLPGMILHQPAGEMQPGFPYAQIFWVTAYNMSLLQLQAMPSEEKQYQGLTSHRDKAFGRLLGSTLILSGMFPNEDDEE